MLLDTTFTSVTGRIGSRGAAGACAASVNSGGHSAITMQRGLFQASISASHASGSIIRPGYASLTACGSRLRAALRQFAVNDDADLAREFTCPIDIARTVCMQRAGTAASWEAAYWRPVVPGDCRPPLNSEPLSA